MMSEVQQSRQIDGNGKTVRELLANRKYSIDYYQREYKWQTKQVSELINDLSQKFGDSYDMDHERAAVKDYGHYFLGSIIISDKEGEKFIIDGQQRLTTLTLLLIFIFHQLDDGDQRRQIADLIFSVSYGERSFNLNIPERETCMDALFTGRVFVPSEEQESITNIVNRYADIAECFPEAFSDRALPFFADWLIENVHLVEITAYSDSDAYTIFETMNDRGLSLAPSDMLKGYLLVNITDTTSRNRANDVWRKRIAGLLEVGKDEDADGIKSWLRSQYADSIRARERNAAPRDFDLIGTEFHRWIPANRERIGLVRSGDYLDFIEKDFVFFSRWYEKLRRAAGILTSELECVYYNAEHNLTLQYPVLLAPVRLGEPDDLVLRKLRVTSTFLDILVARRIWNYKAVDYSTMQYAMFVVMKDIRGKSVDELVEILANKLADSDVPIFSDRPFFSLHGMNGRTLHRLLARMTEYVEVGAGQSSRYLEYAQRGGKDAYEIEHIWADHAEWHVDEFAHPSEFADYRNRIGGLLLLPKSFNASFGDMTYEEKRSHYFGQNLLAASLDSQAYKSNPRFLRFIERSGLPFHAHEEFKKADLDARQQLYTQLAEQVWDPDRLREAGVAEVP